MNYTLLQLVLYFLNITFFNWTQNEEFDDGEEQIMGSLLFVPPTVEQGFQFLVSFPVQDFLRVVHQPVSDFIAHLRWTLLMQFYQVFHFVFFNCRHTNNGIGILREYLFKLGNYSFFSGNLLGNYTRIFFIVRFF